jgi:hypothetical protein
MQWTGKVRGRVLKGGNWRRWAEDRDGWRWRIEEVKAQFELYCHRRRRRRRRIFIYIYSHVQK